MSEFRFESPPSPQQLTGVSLKQIATVVLSGSAAIGLLISLLVAKDFAAAIASRSWQPTPCTIIHSEIAEKSPYQCNVRYSYVFAGTPYTSDVLYQNYAGSEDYYDAQKILDRYPENSTTICMVNPADPHQAILQPRSLRSGLMILSPLLFVLIGGVGLYGIWRKRPQGRSSVELKDRKLLVASFLGFVFLAGAAMLGLFVSTIQRGLAARDWSQVPAVVVHSDVDSHTSSSKTDAETYSVAVLFHYTFQGRRYTSSRYQLSKMSTSDYAGQQQIANSLMQQPNQICYVNPTDPEDAVLDRNYLSAGALEGAIGLGFMAASGIGLIFILRQTRAEHRTKLAAHLSASQRGPAELKPERSPNLDFALNLLAALFCNGIAVVAVCTVAPQWYDGRGDIISTLIVAGVALFGVVFLVGVVVKSRTLSYPRCRIGLNHHPIMAGQQAQLHWQFDGPSDRIKRLKLRVVGFCSVSAQTQPTAPRKSSRFWSANLLDTTHPAEIRSGSRPLLIPPDALPSSPLNDPIRWAILLDADISKPAELQEEFPFQVSSNVTSGAMA